MDFVYGVIHTYIIFHLGMRKRKQKQGQGQLPPPPPPAVPRARKQASKHSTITYPTYPAPTFPPSPQVPKSPFPFPSPQSSPRLPRYKFLLPFPSPHFTSSPPLRPLSTNDAKNSHPSTQLSNSQNPTPPRGDSPFHSIPFILSSGIYAALPQQPPPRPSHHRV